MTNPDRALPKVIWCLWLQGLDQAPEIVRFNFRRWATLNPGWEVRVLDWRDVDRIWSSFPVRRQGLTRPTVSDIVRSRLLLDGGVWVDATVFPTRPLDAWLPDVMRPGGFFAFARPAPDRPVSSWMLAATPQHLLARQWREQVVRFWSTPRKPSSYGNSAIPPDPVWEVSPEGGGATERCPYFWYHYLFRYLMVRDPAFAAAWGRCAAVSAQPPHRLQGLFNARPNPSSEDIRTAVRDSPVHKLTWKHRYPLDLLEAL